MRMETAKLEDYITRNLVRASTQKWPKAGANGARENGIHKSTAHLPDGYFTFDVTLTDSAGLSCHWAAKDLLKDWICL